MKTPRQILQILHSLKIIYTILIKKLRNLHIDTGAWDSVMVKALRYSSRRSRDRFPVVSLGIFSVVPPTEPCVLRSTQPLKVSTRGFS